ncbi:hypothetical protein OS188_00220 [Xanthomarina sp. F1114]|uniref:hypothetical protein n=1 Tax=Xanthomarina sp. F1114 TaxID=2996019 RepID=UPI00225E413A|nr:hypothetical protein [Xanthomarina sp. F1114]MCX7546369.1 hypothetical protein [Xanthomarina sp. F1114]
MKTLTLFFFFLCAFTLTTHAQITKGNWMVGGEVSFQTSENTSNGASDTYSYFFASPNVGYFFIDKLAGGIALDFAFTDPFKSNNSQIYGFSPFFRYYLLKAEKEFNIFSEVSYGYSFGKNGLDEKSNSSDFNLKGGVVLFLNNSVGIELAVSYLNSNSELKSRNVKSKREQLMFGVGFQIHLEK